LILLAQIPPGFFVIGGRDCSGENFPAPLVHDEREGEEPNLVEGGVEQQWDVGVRGRELLEEADGLQVIRRDGEGDAVADGLVEAVVRAVAEEEGLLAIGHLIVVVAELVMDGDKVGGVRVQADFETDVEIVVHVPCAGVADNIAIARADELGALPESFRERLKSERLKKRLAILDHVARIFVGRAGEASLQNFRQVISGHGGRGRDEIVYAAPFLRPDVAEQVGGDHAVGAAGGITIFFDEAMADVGVELDVERLELGPQALNVGRKINGRHVVMGAPEDAGVGEAKFACALIGELDEAGIALPHGCANLMPAGPCVSQGFGIARGGEENFRLILPHAVRSVGIIWSWSRGGDVGRAEFSLAVIATHRRDCIG